MKKIGGERGGAERGRRRLSPSSPPNLAPSLNIREYDNLFDN